MPSIKSSAIVLKSINWRDSSKIVTLFTREEGKISVIAKGARRLKSRYQGILESINLLEVVLYMSATRKIQILGQATLEDSYKDIRGDYEKTGYTFALLELTDIFFKEGSVDGIYFDFLMTLLSEIGRISDPKIVFWYFLIKLGSYLGFRPVFDECATCNKTITSEENVFSMREGAIICRNCGFAPDMGWTLSNSARKSLSGLQKINHKRLSSATITIDERFAYTDFLLTYLRFHSDEKLVLSSLKILS
jgi:DNA repair protein RecO (recombination protein O)